jgi:hypothetical protein
MPQTLNDAITTIVDVISSWYVQDIDDDDTAAKIDFKKSCVELIVDTLFQGGDVAAVASSIRDELSKCLRLLACTEQS